jgi:serine/threonine-protein kinase
MTTRNTPTDESEQMLQAGAQEADEAERSSQTAASGARMPSISSMIRYMAPDAIAERRRRARENFGRVTPLPNGVTKAPDDSPQPAADVPPAERVSAPSPWARSRDGEIDRAALPSAAMPVVPPTSSDVVPPIERPKAAGSGARERRNKWLIVAGCAAVAVLGPIVMIVAGSMRKPIEPRGSGAASARAAESATATASVPVPATSASVTPAPTDASSSAPTADTAPTGAAPPVTPRTAPERPPAPPVRKAAPTAADAGPPAPPPQPKPNNNGDPLLNE